MNDDFGTPGAVAALFDLTREVNTLLSSDEPLSRGALEAIDAAYRRMAGDALGVLPDDLEEKALGEGLTADLVETLIAIRADLRANKQWALADSIRDRLSALGVQLKDASEGTTWTIA